MNRFAGFFVSQKSVNQKVPVKLHHGGDISEVLDERDAKSLLLSRALSADFCVVWVNLKHILLHFSITFIYHCILNNTYV